MKGMIVFLVLAATVGFVVLVAGAGAQSERPSVLLCISGQTYDGGSLSTADQQGLACPEAEVEGRPADRR